MRLRNLSLNYRVSITLMKLEKLRGTLKVAGTLILARTFGHYEVTIHDYGLVYARYRWRNQVWAFPTGPIEED